MVKKPLILLSLLFFGASKNVFASSCCGQNISSFNILHKNERLNVGLGYSYATTLGRLREDSRRYYVWKSDKQRQVKSINANFTGSVNDSWQWLAMSSALDISYQQEGYQENYNHLSDTLLGTTYEAVSEYTYDPIKPTVYVSFLLNLPTGNSASDKVTLTEGAGVTGHNQWGAGFGVTLFKVWQPWQLKLQSRSLVLLAKEFDNQQVSNFYDHLLSAFLTYNSHWLELYFSGGLSWSMITKKEVNGIRASDSEVTTNMFSVGRVFGETLSVSFNFSDQSLFGESKNVLINRTYALTFNYNIY
ncbi:MAG: hypothetical protein KDD40_09290 [Bdellovibrionales bacterium]|nr:hypothetical protein [Bdellovibrionales bacterium]